MPTHSKQHFVPRVYLAAWTDPDTPEEHDPYVWLHPLEGGPAKRKAPRGIFTETDIYTAHGAKGRDLTFEHGLGKLENMFARIMREIIVPREPISLEDRVVLCTFIAALKARTPTQRDHLQSQFQQVVDRSDSLAAEFEQMTEEEQETAAAVHIEGSGGTIDVEDLRKLAANPMLPTLVITMTQWPRILAQMNMTILCAPGPSTFITSDAPVTLVDREQDRRTGRAYGPSILSPTAEITLPLSPTRAVVLTRITTPLYHTISDGLVREINQTTAAFAHEYLVFQTERGVEGLRLKKKAQEPPAE